ncbi:SPOR domain-containing protein [Treponema pedis]|uniref:SPOR domain-containing protein n=1 Tax=Treponema pedis TaxID=409322 RepID=UPI0004228660|nr:SPOR domain-containing protein [Treponema pedis]
MKKLIVSIVFILSFSCIWAVWEGNGGIGAASDFPAEGLFVRSDMFPKHTLLEITNLEKNITLRAVVVGQSGIPGLLISLSPELGAKLAIASGKVVRVRVVTPSPVQEIGDDGIAAGTSSPESMDLDSNPALLVASETESPEYKAEKPRETDSKAEEPVSSPIVYEEPPETVPPAEESKREEPEKESVPVKEAEPEPSQAVPPPVEPVPEKQPEVKLVPEPPVTVYMEPADLRPPIVVSKITKPKKNNEKEPEKVKEISGILKPAEKKEKAEPPVTTVKEPAAPKKEKEAEEPAVSVIPPVTESEKPQTEPDKEVGYVASIVQPKADEPEEDKKPEEVGHIMEPESVPESPAKEETEEIYEVTEPVKTEEEAPAAVEEKPPVKEYLESDKPAEKLKKGELYIQIAVYNDKYSADSAVKNHGKQYPVFVEEDKKRGKTVYTVFIGPLQREETGAVIERFKKLGFEGAFLKRGK